MRPVRAELIGHMADQIPIAPRPLLVAVDGRDGAGKTRFADELATALAEGDRVTVRASIDAFHHPREYRHRLGRTPETVWNRSFDYHAVRRELLDPWLEGPGMAYRPVWHDLDTDEHADLDPRPVPVTGVLVVDGVFAQRPELEQAWDLVIYLDVPLRIAVSRMAARDGTVDDPEHPDLHRYVAAQQHYQDTCSPRENADVVIDNSDLDHPFVTAGPGAVRSPASGSRRRWRAIFRRMRRGGSRPSGPGR